ncbi:MAG: FHA domain-containing protein [Actinomycetota bacterium]|nr:FHA domain-containing protein [Actinomycetota bacterium]
MPEAVLQILKYFFLFLIFLFLARAVKAMLLEISGPKKASPVQRTPEVQRIRTAKPPSKLVVTPEGGSSKTYDIADELIIGRADKCQVILTDRYASQVHARVFRKDENIFLEDMGSTNGTRLNKRKVTSATPVTTKDSARIGNTELEFRR